MRRDYTHAMETENAVWRSLAINRYNPPLNSQQSMEFSLQAARRIKSSVAPEACDLN